MRSSRARRPSTSRAADAREAALRALRHRDLSVHVLRRRLRERGFSEPELDDAVESLLRSGLLDDARYAESRALALAERGAGDALIRHRLAEEGIASELVELSLVGIDSEAERALRVVERRGAGARTARYLSAKGFAEDAVSRAVAGAAADRLR